MTSLTISTHQSKYHSYRQSHQHEMTLELVIIDPSINNWQQLVAGVRPECEVAILNPNYDGIEQITQILNSLQPGSLRGLRHQTRYWISALHIICHESPGCLYLGSSQLKLRYLPLYRHQLQQWRSAFTDDADILIYGCEFAANGSVISANASSLAAKSCTRNSCVVSSAANPFLALFQQLTGANIAATTTLTGCELQGGNWQLEVALGEISTPLAFTTSTLNAYPSVFALNFSPQTLVI